MCIYTLSWLFLRAPSFPLPSFFLFFFYFAFYLYLYLAIVNRYHRTYRSLSLTFFFLFFFVCLFFLFLRVFLLLPRLVLLFSPFLVFFFFFSSTLWRRSSSECFVDRNGTTQGSDVVQPPEPVSQQFATSSATGTYTRNLKIKRQCVLVVSGQISWLSHFVFLSLFSFFFFSKNTKVPSRKKYRIFHTYMCV